MRGSPRIALALALALAAGVAGCGDHHPTQPVNHSPVISGWLVYPGAVRAGDSVVVAVYASDPDGDALVYDWETDCRLRVKDAADGMHLYDTSDHSHVFYATDCGSVPDTGFVWCTARDRKGGRATREVLIERTP